MSEQYRIFRRGAVFYSHDAATGQQKSLRTKDLKEARRLLAAVNEATHSQSVNLQLARVYLTASEPKMATRTWLDVAYAVFSFKSGTTKARWKSVLKDKALQSIYGLTLIETTAEDFLGALKAKTVSTNVYLRRLHNFALDMNWLLAPIIPKRQWPTIRFKSKRAITPEEHQKIIDREPNTERKLFYELCWHLGGSQSDIAQLHAEDIDWTDRTVSFVRVKLRNRTNLQPPIIHFGPQTEKLFKQLPQSGLLFPYLAAVRSGDRATEFKQRCDGLAIIGISLHSYRYTWAERAKKAGYPLRFAMVALGHNSKAIHHAYARKAQVQLPSLEEYEADASSSSRIISFSQSERPTHDGNTIENSFPVTGT